MKNVVNRTLVWVKKNVIYHLKSIMQRKGFESRDGEWTEGEASIQHPFSIHSASIGHPLQASGRQVASSLLRSWKYAATLTLLLTLSVGQMWATTVYFKNTSNWTASNVKCHYWGGTNGTTWSGATMTRIGSTAYYKQDIGNNTMCIFNNNGNNQTADQTAQDGKICYYNNNSPYWNYGSRTGLTIYFDIRKVTDWGTPYLRVGRSDHNSAYSMSLVAGTKFLYSVSSPSYDNYSAYTIANSQGWTNSHTIYQPSDEKPTGDYAITKLINYQNSNILENNVYIQAASKSSTSDGADYWNVSVSSSLPSYAVSYSKTGTGTLTVTKYNGSTYDALSSGSSVKPTQIIKIETTPGSGYVLSSLSVSGATQIDATSTYYVTGATTISATFVAEETHDVTISYKCGTATIQTATTETAVGVSTARSITAPTIDGYTFSSWTKGSGITITSGTTTSATISITSGASGNILQANYTAKACKLYKSTAAKDGTLTDKGAMTFDASTKAYYKDITTDAKPYYFRFYFNGATYYSTDWSDNTYASGKTVTANGSNVDCDKDVTSWGNKPSIVFNGQSDAAIRIWFDYQNKKVWITETTYAVTINNGDHGTVSPNGSQNIGGSGLSITATPAAGYAFKQWSKSGSGVTLSSTTTNPTTVTATSTGSVTAQYKADWYVYGTMSPTAWTTEWADGALTADGDNFSVTLSLAANTTYQFKMYKSSGNNHYWSNSTDINNITATTSGKLLYNNDGTNMSMTTTIAGSYKFTIASPNADHPSLTITYPSVYAISGGFNSWTETTNLAFTGNDGSYSVSINGSSTNYEFKVLDNGVWYGHSDKTFTATESNVTLSSPNNNIKLKADVYPSGTYTFAYNKSTHKLGVTYPTSYVVTFGKRTGGNTVTAKINNTTAFSSGTKIAPNTSVTFSQTAAAGYTFEGWYSASTGGTKLSSDATYTVSITAAKNVYANYTPNQYEVSFDNNGGSGATPDDITVTYGAAYGTLPAGPTPPGVDQFAGWYTAQTGGTRVTAETLVSTASEHTLWARFESTFTVTVQYKCGDDVLRPQITTHASETSVAATIIAPNIVGYAFVNWTGSNATFADATNDTTTVNVSAATAVVANYTAVPMVCFKNNLDWDEVYVTFDCYWKDWNGQQVVGNMNKPYYKMTQLGQTDIYYCVIPSEYTNNNYANWKGNIAFDNKGFGDYTTEHIGTYDPFWKGEFLGRADFDPNATMYIPYNGDKETRNEGTYYPTGCWLQYNTTYSGYKVNIWDAINGNSGTQLNYPGTELRAETAGGFEFKASVYLSNSASARGVKLYKDKTKNSNEIWYTNVNNEANTITSATTTLPWSFVGAGSDEDWQRCRILPEVSGDYIFTVSFATGRPMVNIEYPVTTGDFRLVYKDRATWNNTHDASWKQISPVFKHKANRVDTASFFISYGSSPTLALEKCTKIEGGVETWTQQGSNISLSSISSKGVYNFTVTQNSTGSSATAAYLGAYTGNYYIRTDASDGGWGSYSKGSNNLTYSEYSLTHGGDFGPYSHYFMRHVDNGQNIKFIIANDYNPCLTDTLVNDTIVNEWISSEANVRFMWHNGSNKIGRAYISGSSIVADRFLVLEGDTHLYDENGNSLTGTHKISDLNDHEMKFFDDQNWIYETTVQANPLERVKLTAKFNNKVQYFYGAAGARTTATTHQLIGGSGSGKYKMRVVYDFKTNRLLAAWLPDGDITTEFTIDADVMIIRYHQQDAQQITFTSGSKLKEVKTVYGAMKFNKYRLNNQSEESGHADLGISQYERDLFFISFPFDVKLNDVFGFGNYGKHWIIEYYDGKGRAEKGFWADSPTNWKFVTTDMKDSYTLKANEGYVLALDLDKLTLESSVWNYGVENVYLYFPSTANVNDIEATSRTITIDQTGYQCTIDRRTNKNVPDVNKDRRVADSYWHLIGVPSYANASNSTSSTWTGTVPNLDPANWTTKAPFVYDWNASTNKCGVISTTSSTFKPMRAYLTQYAKPTIVWSSVNATPQSVAARRSIQHVSNYEFRLELQYDGQEADRTFVSLREDEEVTNDFDFSFDLCKELYGGFMPATQIYTIIGADIPAAGNCLPLALEQETSVPVGVVAKVAGAYTFAMPDGTEGLSVTLVDNITGTHTNLALGDYTVELEAGTYDNRFMLVIDPRTTTTSVETVSAEGKDAPRKVFINGLMYIQRGNALYDTTGRKVE